MSIPIIQLIYERMIRAVDIVSYLKKYNFSAFLHIKKRLKENGLNTQHVLP